MKGESKTAMPAPQARHPTKATADRKGDGKGGKKAREKERGWLNSGQAGT